MATRQRGLHADDIAHQQHLTEQLRKLRLKRNLTQQDVAARLGIGYTAVSALERGIRGDINTHTLHRWARALNRTATLTPHGIPDPPYETRYTAALLAMAHADPNQAATPTTSPGSSPASPRHAAGTTSPSPTLAGPPAGSPPQRSSTPNAVPKARRCSPPSSATPAHWVAISPSTSDPSPNRSPAVANETTITIIGNLTADPELRFTPSGVAVAKFTVASTPRSYDKASGEWKDGEALFLNCSVWRESAEHVAESLQRGARVLVTGRLKQRSYETKEGEKRTVFEVDVDEVGPSLRYATAKVQKMARSSGGQPARGGSQGDPWTSAAPAAGGAGFDSEPPF